MFNFLRKKKVGEEWIRGKVVTEPEPELQHTYDVEIRFRDGHEMSVKGAQYAFHLSKRDWLIARDGDEEKCINTSEAEEVTIIRR